MKIWIVTLTHMDINLLTASLEQTYSTVSRGEFHEHVLVDHHWPICPWIHRRELLMLAERFGCKLITPYENMGGAGGYNWAVSQIPMADDDVFVGIDGDSFPASHGFITAMQKVISDSRYGAVSLKINADLNTKVWEYETINGETVMRPAGGGIEMINVTMWKVGMFRSIGGFKGLPFYGGVEIPIFTRMHQMGLRHGYLRDYSEDLKTIQPHPEYSAWKAAHVAGTFPGNFCDWVKGMEA